MADSASINNNNFPEAISSSSGPTDGNKLVKTDPSTGRLSPTLIPEVSPAARVSSTSETLSNSNESVIWDLSAGGETASLPDATGNLGAVYRLGKGDNSLNKLTIDTAVGGQLVMGQSSIKLCTTGEYIILQSTGVGYTVLYHWYDSSPVDLTPSLSTYLSAGITPQSDSAYSYYRDGKFYVGILQINTATTTASQASATLPTGIVSSLTSLSPSTPYALVIGRAGRGVASTNNDFSCWIGTPDDSGIFFGSFNLTSSTPYTSLNWNDMFGGTQYWFAEFRVPILDWIG